MAPVSTPMANLDTVYSTGLLGVSGNITEAKNSIQKYGVLQGYTNPGHKVVMAIKCFMVVPSICGSSVCNMLHVISLVS